METILLTIFAFTLLYIGIANRLTSFIRMLAIQGLLLFGITFFKLTEINWFNLVMILLETIIFKTVLIPWFLNYVLKKNKIIRETEPFVSYFWSLILITGFIILSYIIAGYLGLDKSTKADFMVAFASLLTGIYIIITRKKIITHLMGYMILENGVFLLSLTIGAHQPMMVNLGILLDIFVSVLVLGLFMNKIGNTFEEMSIENLSNLKD
ncbi:MAG: NADH-quinone oxidoreductase subunit K [Bacteroidota bacterium]